MKQRASTKSMEIISEQKLKTKKSKFCDQSLENELKEAVEGTKKIFNVAVNLLRMNKNSSTMATLREIKNDDERGKKQWRFLFEKVKKSNQEAKN